MSRPVIIAARPRLKVATDAAGNVRIMAAASTADLAGEADSREPILDYDHDAARNLVLDAWGALASRHMYLRDATAARARPRPWYPACTQRLLRHVQAHGPDVAAAPGPDGVWDLADARDDRPRCRMRMTIGGRDVMPSIGLNPVANDGGRRFVPVSYITI